MKWRAAWAAAVGLLLLTVVLATRASAAGGEAEIASAGPLTRIIVTGDLNCQVTHQADSSFEFFGGEEGACGTFLAVGEALFAPALVPSAGFGAATPWTPVSQSPITGSGTSGDPFRVVTVVEAPGTALQVEQTDSYVVGEESYRTDVRITNGGGDQRVIVYRAADCYLQDSDIGFGRVDDGAPACVISQEPDARIEQWVPLTGGSRFMEGAFSDVWGRIAARESFADTCLCETAIDNGAGLSWDLSIPGGGTSEVSHLTFFSPAGRRHIDVPLRDAVPEPAEISLDPLVIATSVAVAAGIVLVIPFPAALFNSTLEQHSAEVTATRRRVQRWLAGMARRALALGSDALRGRGREGSPGVGRAPAEPARVAPGSDDPGGRTGNSIWSGPRGIALLVLVSAVLYALLDPTFGLSAETGATVLGLAIGLSLVLAAYAIPLALLSRGLGARLTGSALPGTILIAAASVVISRLADFQPGYLYGLIIGFGFTRELSKLDEGRLEAIATACAFAVGIIAWLLLPVVRGPDDAAGTLVNVVLETAFVTVLVAGVEATAFGMLPLRFLPGERVRTWSRRAWLILFGLGVFAFLHILVNPTTGYLADTSRTELSTVIWLLVAFGGGSVLFWAYFRFRPGAANGQSATPLPPDPPGEAS